MSRKYFKLLLKLWSIINIAYIICQNTSNKGICEKHKKFQLDKLCGMISDVR